MTRTALAVALAAGPALVPGTGASAALLDAQGAPSALLGAGSGAPTSSSGLSLEALPTIHVQVGELLNVEAEPLPVKVKVGSLPPIETPPLPKAELPSTPPVETPATPVEVPTVPSTSTPVPLPTGSSTTPSQPTSSSSGSGARAAGAGSSNATGGSTQAAGASGTAAPAATSGTPSARAGAKRRLGTAAAKSHAATGAQRRAGAGGTPTTLAATTAPTASSPVAPAGSPGAGSAHHKAASSNPLETIGRQIPFPVPVPDWSKPIILVLLLLAILFAVRSRLATLRARRLEGQRETMLSDLDDMQAALVPAIPERLGGLAVSVAYEPADGPAAGGDFYDLFELEPGKVAIVLGDVVGHGRPALTQAALTRYTLRAYLQAGLEPRAALALAGSVLSTPGEKRFATVVVAIHDSASGRLTYACAGHPPPISIGFDAPEPLTVCCSAPICCDLPTGRRQTIVSLPLGGRLCFFSDGLPEARVGDDLLGRERLIELTDELGPSAGAAALLQRIRDEASSTPDDMVACIVSAAARAPVAAASAASPAGAASPAVAAGPAVADQVEELEVDVETLGEPRLRRFLDACRIDPTSAASLLARAGEIARRDGTALLRIERRTGRPTAVVTAGRSVPDIGSVTAEIDGPAGPALALGLAAAR